MDRHMTGCQCLVTVMNCDEGTIKGRFPETQTADAKSCAVERPPKIYKIQQN